MGPQIVWNFTLSTFGIFMKSFLYTEEENHERVQNGSCEPQGPESQPLIGRLALGFSLLKMCCQKKGKCSLFVVNIFSLSWFFTFLSLIIFSTHDFINFIPHHVKTVSESKQKQSCISHQNKRKQPRQIEQPRIKNKTQEKLQEKLCRHVSGVFLCKSKLVVHHTWKLTEN